MDTKNKQNTKKMSGYLNVSNVYVEKTWVHASTSAKILRKKVFDQSSEKKSSSRGKLRRWSHHNIRSCWYEKYAKLEDFCIPKPSIFIYKKRVVVPSLRIGLEIASSFWRILRSKNIEKQYLRNSLHFDEFFFDQKFITAKIGIFPSKKRRTKRRILLSGHWRSLHTS